MAIKLLVNGAFGRMGQISAEAIRDNPNFELVGQTGREFNLKKSIEDSGAQVVLDFTHPDAVLANALTIIEAGVRPVIGTSGLKKEEVKQLQARCASLKRGGIIVPNFSLGAVLMMKHAQAMSRYMPAVEIIEMHHDQKVDSPSGTALRTAELMAESHPGLHSSLKSGKEILPGARGANYYGIHIHSVRLPGFLAHQQIIFGNKGETLTLRHDTLDRSCFVPGICLACEAVMNLDHMVYGLETLI